MYILRVIKRLLFNTVKRHCCYMSVCLSLQFNHIYEFCTKYLTNLYENGYEYHASNIPAPPSPPHLLPKVLYPAL